jgi:hypothetical protein
MSEFKAFHLFELPGRDGIPYLSGRWAGVAVRVRIDPTHRPAAGEPRRWEVVFRDAAEAEIRARRHQRRAAARADLPAREEG